MKHVKLLSTLLLLYFTINQESFAQNEGYGCFHPDSSSTESFSVGPSFNGYQHTPVGDLHVLVVIVQYGNINLVTDWTLSWPNDSNVLPVFAQDSVLGINQLFNKVPGTISSTNATQNLSEYYYIMSGGEFRVTADIYPQQVPVNFPIGGTLDQAAWSAMNKAAINWITQDQINQGNSPDAFWAQYDNRTNTPDFQYDNSNSQPDSILDYLVFIHRNKGSGTSGGATPINFDDPDWSIPNTSYKVRDRCGHTQGKNSVSKFLQWDFFTHEAAHNLYDSPHYFGANGVSGQYFSTQYGWGMMSRQYSTFFTATAFEKWWLDWIDTVYTHTASQSPKIYQIRDLATHNEALRVEIPNSGGQYLWLEVHDTISRWDKKLNALGGNLNPRMPSGVYTYLSREWDRDIDKLEQNGLRNLSKEGKHDLIRTLDSLYVTGVNGAGSFNRVFNRDQRVNNPFSGFFSTEAYLFDRDGNDSIYRNTGGGNAAGTERELLYAEKVSGINISTYAVSGDQDDGWQVGDSIGMIIGHPINNYSTFNGSSQRMENPYYLNGLLIEILGYNSTTGVYSIRVSSEEYGVRTDQRWCGNLVWNENKQLNIASGKKIELALGGTPDRTRIDTFGTQTFTSASHLSMEGGGKLLIGNNAEFIVRQKSGLTVNSGSRITVQSGGALIVKEEGWLDIKNGGSVIIEDGGKILIDSMSSISMQSGSLVDIYGNGFLEVERTAGFDFHGFANLRMKDDSSHIYVKGKLSLLDGASFQLAGNQMNGYWRFGLEPPTGGGVFANNIFSDSTSHTIVIAGFNPADTNRVLLRIDDHTSFIPDTSLATFTLVNGTALLGEESQLTVHKGANNLTLSNCIITASDTSKKFKAVSLFDLMGGYSLDRIRLSYSQYGLVLASASEPPVSLDLTNSTFHHNQFYGLWASEVPVHVSNTSFYRNDVGWQGINQVWPNWFDQSYADTNTTAGIQHFGAGNFLFDEGYARNNSSGLLLYGDILARGNCANITNNGYAGVNLNIGAMLDVSALPRENFSWSDLSYNYHTIYLSDAGATLLEDGYNDLEPLPAGPNSPRVLLGTQRFKGVQTFSAERNRWNLLNQSPVSGLDYDVTSSLNSQDLFYTDGRPEQLACGVIPTNYHRAESWLMDCRECDDIEMQINPAYGTGGTSVSVPLDSAVRDAIAQMRLYGGSGTDWEAAWRFVQILEYGYGTISDDEAMLLDLSFSYLMQAVSGACANGEIAISQDESLVLDVLSTAVLGHIDDSLEVDRSYGDWLRWATAKANLYQMIQAMTLAETEIQALSTSTSGDEQAFFDQWLCRRQAKKDFKEGLLDVSGWLAALDSCGSVGSARLRNRMLTNLGEGTFFKEITLFPNPAENTLHLSLPNALEEKISIEIFDLMGRMLGEKTYRGLEVDNDYTFSIPVGALPRGMVLVRVSHGEQEVTKRVYLE